MKPRKYVDPGRIVEFAGREVDVKLAPGVWTRIMVTGVEHDNVGYQEVRVRGVVTGFPK